MASAPDKPSFAEAKADHVARWGRRQRRPVPASPEVTAHAAALVDRSAPWPPTWRPARGQ